LISSRKETRVLHLEPGLPKDGLVCTLQHISLADEQRCSYETISYALGTLKDRPDVAIIVQGIPTPVHASSAAALRCIRYRDKPRTLWIDTICINQKYMEERSQQVGMMNLIFAKTDLNLVWLGEADVTTSSLVRETMEAVKDEATAYAKAFADQTIRQTLENWQKRIQERDVCIWRQRLQGLFNSPWFGRLWVGMLITTLLISRSLTC
jgi:hypothetical protein